MAFLKDIRLNEDITTFTDGLYLALTGDQTVGGVKTFSSFPVTPSSAPTTDYQTANKKYVDDNGGSFAGTMDDITDGITYVKTENNLTDALVSTIGSALQTETSHADVLVDGDIGVTVQGYSANTVIDASYVHTDTNYTSAEASKLSGIAAGAEVNVQSDWNAVSGDAQILNKPSIPVNSDFTLNGLSEKSYNNLTDKPTIPVASDVAYDATSWNGNTDVPTKNAVRDKIETMGGGITLLDVYPVGAIYISVDSTSPATLFGGTWAAFGAGKVLVGIDSGDTSFDTVEETGGAKTHTLTTAEMPTHNHIIPDVRSATTGIESSAIARSVDTTSTRSTDIRTENAGSGNAHNNLQPYIVCYFWKRTA